MEKLQLENILVKDANLQAFRVKDTDLEVKRLFEQTKENQAKVLKLKEVDQERLRMVVQL